MNEQEIKAFTERFPAVKKVEVNNELGCVYVYGKGTLPQGFFEDAESLFNLRPIGAGGGEHDYDYRIIMGLRT